MTAELEGDFEITKQLTDAEQKEWEDVFNLADAGNRVRRKEVEEVTMVKEMNQLMYVPAVWSDDEEHNKEDAKAAETEEEEEDKEKTAKGTKVLPLVAAHFMGYTLCPETNKSNQVGPLNPA